MLVLSGGEMPRKNNVGNLYVDTSGCGPALLSILLVVFFIIIIASVVRVYWGESATPVTLAILFAVYVTYKLIIKSAEKNNLEKAREKERIRSVGENELNCFLDDLIKKHAVTLRKNYLLKVKRDDYGNLFEHEWNNEIDYFIKNVVEKEYYGDGRIKNRLDVNCYSFLVYDKIMECIKSHSEECEDNSRNDNMNHCEFEIYCCEILQKNGWEASLTKASGDVGVDIVGVKNGKKVVFQCKKYSKPVGIKAVQEVASGMKHYGASEAYVITNATYTKSAQELAITTGVRLLHYSELNSVFT